MKTHVAAVINYFNNKNDSLSYEEREPLERFIRAIPKQERDMIQRAYARYNMRTAKADVLRVVTGSINKENTFGATLSAGAFEHVFEDTNYSGKVTRAGTDDGLPSLGDKIGEDV